VRQILSFSNLEHTYTAHLCPVYLFITNTKNVWQILACSLSSLAVSSPN